MDVAVTETVLWMGPGVFTTSGTSADLIAEDTGHNSTLTVSGAMATHSGNYSCSVTLESTSNFIIDSSSISKIETVTVGE